MIGGTGRSDRVIEEREVSALKQTKSGAIFGRPLIRETIQVKKFRSLIGSLFYETKLTIFFTTYRNLKVDL